MADLHGQITLLLRAWRAGDRQAGEALLRTVYGELKLLAARQLRLHPESFSATELVHEWYLRSVPEQQPEWENRAQFFGIASRLIRNVLVDHARRRRAVKRGGGSLRVTLEEADATAPGGPDVLDLDRALVSLAERDTLAARLVELRYFGGLEISEAAHLLETSPATLVRKWRAARAWLRAELASERAT